MKFIPVIILALALWYLISTYRITFDVVTVCDLSPADMQERSRDMHYYRTYGNYCPELMPEGAVSTYMLSMMPAREV